MEHRGCHTWTAPDPEDIEQAARVVPDAPEVWTPATNPHLATVRQLWPGATLYTVGTTPPTQALGQWHIHRDVDPNRLDLHTLDRPRRTVVIPWPCPSASSPDAPS